MTIHSVLFASGLVYCGHVNVIFFSVFTFSMGFFSPPLNVMYIWPSKYFRILDFAAIDNSRLTKDLFLSQNRPYASLLRIKSFTSLKNSMISSPVFDGLSRTVNFVRLEDKNHFYSQGFSTNTLCRLLQLKMHHLLQVEIFSWDEKCNKTTGSQPLWLVQTSLAF